MPGTAIPFQNIVTARAVVVRAAFMAPMINVHTRTLERSENPLFVLVKQDLARC
jgi:hypothetical protein